MLVKLERNQEMLEAMGRMAKVGGWQLDLLTQTLVWTLEVYRIHEVTDDFVPTFENAVRFYAPEYRSVIIDVVSDAINIGKNFDCIFEIITAKNRRRWVRSLGQAIYADQKIVSVFGTFQDITEQRLAEEALQESEKTKQAILDGISANIAFVNEHQEIIWANKNASVTAARPLPEMIGKTCYSLWADPKAPCKNCPTLRTMSSHIAEVGTRVGPEGKTWSERSEPVFNSDGTLLGVVEIVQDITRQVQMEARIRQAEKMESIGILAAGIAHDFNNILFAILGNAELAGQAIDPRAPVAKHLQHIVKAADRAKLLVKKILAFSRHEDQAKQVLLLSTEVEESLGFLRVMQPSSVLFDVQLGNANYHILADSISIHEILINLFTNASQAMNAKGTISVRLSDGVFTTPIEGRLGETAPGSYVILEIQDTGMGMSAQILERIFEPFFTTKSVDQGTGMGLAVVYGLMQIHHGNIQVQSEIGKGTTFTLFFPQPESKTAGVVTEVVKGRGERILFVDDESEIVAMASRGLTLFGYEVMHAGDGVEAFELLRESTTKIDVLITDQTMPHMTGIELAYAINRIRPELPIIITTDYSPETHKELNAIPGVHKICYKPINLQELALAVHECLPKDLL